MKQLFLFGLLILHGGFAAAQEVYGPDHKGMNNALWNDDSERIATWGWSPYVYVWRDSDGLLLLELDHRPIMTWSPGQNVVASNASISDLHWSEDGELIITRAHTRRPDNFVHEQAWSAETGELLYSYVIKAFHPHGLNSNLHKLIEDENLVFTWAYDRLALVDINPKSETVGEVLSEIDFGDRAIVSLIWSEDALTALLKLRDDGKRYCDTCPTSFKLVDTDLSSEPFGQTLWQTTTSAGAQAYLWHDATDPLAIYSEGKIELWDLNRASAGFGRSLLRIDLEYKWFHSVLLGTNNRRLIVIEQRKYGLCRGSASRRWSPVP